MKAFCLLLPDGFSKDSIFFGALHPLYKAVIAASGHCKESTHYQYRILFPVTVDYCILCLCSHFLPADRRKSRSNSFSILNRLISYACSAIISPGAESFRGRPFGRGVIPASIFACLWLYRLIQFLICDLLNPNRSAISCRGSTSLSHSSEFPVPMPVYVCISFVTYEHPLYRFIVLHRGVLSIVRFYWFGSDTFRGCVFSIDSTGKNPDAELPKKLTGNWKRGASLYRSPCCWEHRRQSRR